MQAAGRPWPPRRGWVVPQVRHFTPTPRAGCAPARLPARPIAARVLRPLTTPSAVVLVTPMVCANW